MTGLVGRLLQSNSMESTFTISRSTKSAPSSYMSRILRPNFIEHLALGERDVDRVEDPVFEVVGLEICGFKHGSVWDTSIVTHYL